MFLVDSPRLNILFVCGRNLKRSPTAAKIFQSDPRFSVRAAGTSDSSPRRIREGDLAWADLILVMERKYAGRIQAAFPDAEKIPPIESLEISDDYEFMDPELVELLRDGVNQLLAERAERFL